MTDDHEEDDAFENGVLRDQKRFRVPLMMSDTRTVRERAATGHIRVLDAPLHQPGFVRNPLTVEERQSIYDAYDASVSAAWKNRAAGGDGAQDRNEGGPHRQGAHQDATKDAKRAAYAAYDADIANAWRGAGR